MSPQESYMRMVYFWEANVPITSVSSLIRREFCLDTTEHVELLRECCSEKMTKELNAPDACNLYLLLGEVQ